MDSTVRAHILIEGRVQGVGYRAFVYKNAIRQGLSGWVQNLSDGRVELEVQGPRESIDLFLAALKKGPSLAQVDQLYVNWQEAQEEGQEFWIISQW